MSLVDQVVAYSMEVPEILYHLDLWKDVQFWYPRFAYIMYYTYALVLQCLFWLTVDLAIIVVLAPLFMCKIAF